MTMLSDLVEKRLAALDLDLGFQERVCLTQISKDLNGTLQVSKREPQICTGPGCETLKIFAAIQAQVTSHDPCDQHPELDSNLTGELLFAFQVREAGRGLFLGQAEWRNDKGLVLPGTMSEIVNAGTHRRPAAQCDELCNERERITGMFEGVVRNGPQHQGCILLASYALRLHPDIPSLDTSFQGTVEGLLICPCSSPA